MDEDNPKRKRISLVSSSKRAKKEKDGEDEDDDEKGLKHSVIFHYLFREKRLSL